MCDYFDVVENKSNNGNIFFAFWNAWHHFALLLVAADDRSRWCCSAVNTAIYAIHVGTAESIESIKLTDKQKSDRYEDKIIRVCMVVCMGFILKRDTFHKSPSNETMWKVCYSMRFLLGILHACARMGAFFFIYMNFIFTKMRCWSTLHWLIICLQHFLLILCHFSIGILKTNVIDEIISSILWTRWRAVFLRFNYSNKQSSNGSEDEIFLVGYVWFVLFFRHANFDTFKYEMDQFAFEIV